MGDEEAKEAGAGVSIRKRGGSGSPILEIILPASRGLFANLELICARCRSFLPRPYADPTFPHRSFAHGPRSQIFEEHTSRVMSLSVRPEPL